MVAIDLDGPQGNAFALMGNVRTWCRQMDRDHEPIIQEMTSGDYHHLLDVIDREFGHVVEWIHDPREDDDADEDDDDYYADEDDDDEWGQ